MNHAIDTKQLVRVYKIRGGKKSVPKELVALKDVDMYVENGELFGLLGPNGAGKTTLIKILTTLLAPTSGQAWVAGIDVNVHPERVRRKINMVSGGESSGYGLLTVRENLWMFSQFYGIPSAQANQRIKVLLDVVGLSDRLNTKSSDLSTGLRQKMNLVRGFLTDPDVLFLDEPTLGLDVGASRDVRRFIRKWVDEKQSRTVLLTTHYMVEADELCDRVAIINEGRVLACDTPANLKQCLQQDVLFWMKVNSLSGLSESVLEKLPGVSKVTHTPQDGYAELDLILEADDALAGIVNAFTANNVHILNLQKREPTLEDVFVDLVGRSIHEVGQMIKMSAEVTKNTGFRLFLQTVWGRAYPRMIGLQREKSWLFFDILLPLLAVSAYVFVYRAINAPEEFIGFVVVGGAMTAFWMNVLWSMSSQLFWEKEQGNLALYIMAPNSMMAVLLGMALGGLVATALRATVIIIFGSLLFQVSYAVSSFVQLMIVFLLTMVALYGMGMMFASLFLLLSREAWHLSNLAQEPVYLFAGFYFPIKNFNFWIAASASVIPLTLGLDAIRQLVFPSGASFGFLDVGLEIGILCILCVLFVTAAKYLLSYMELIEAFQKMHF